MLLVLWTLNKEYTDQIQNSNSNKRQIDSNSKLIYGTLELNWSNSTTKIYLNSIFSWNIVKFDQNPNLKPQHK